ncbi:hypothetical protein K438DRAFT_1844598 [Mycena galopus ATCC 62051]|nr:hypothetical protein K438DRAFT_1844598 [Mycena galopus ATCC 62051]
MDLTLSSATLNGFRVVSYVDVGFLALLVYDTLLNINEEYQHIWRRKWSLVKCLYLWTRYSTFIDIVSATQKHLDSHITPTTCGNFTTFDTVFAVVGVAIAEVILMIRTYALYGRPKQLRVFFIIMWLCIIGINVWPVVEWSQSVTPDVTSLPAPLTSCNYDHSNGIILVSYGSLLLGETIIVLLTLWKGLNTSVWAGPFHQNSFILTTFYRDGLFWYLVMLMIFIGNVVLQSAVPMSVGEIPLRVLHSILACRLVIHVRAVAAKEEQDLQITSGSLRFANSGTNTSI